MLDKRPIPVGEAHLTRREAGHDALIRLRAMRAEFQFVAMLGGPVPASTFETLWLPEVNEVIAAIEWALSTRPSSDKDETSGR